MNKFPDRLKYLRISKDLTQDKLAKDIKEIFNYPITKATISQYENGKREPNINMLIFLSQYFSCSIDYLVGISEHNKIVNSTEFMGKMIMLKSFVDILSKMDITQAHLLNKMLINFMDDNEL